MTARVLKLEAVKGKQGRHVYLIEADQGWLYSLTSRYRGNSAPAWWALPVPWLWNTSITQLSTAELGALVRIICMLMRDRAAYESGKLETDRRELRMHGITDQILRRISHNLSDVRISLISESGEIKQL